MSASFTEQICLNDKITAKMRCNKLNIDLFSYAEGTLSEEDTTAVEKHLEDCVACSSFVAEIRGVLAVMEAEKKVTENPFFFTRVEAKMLKPSKQPQLSLVRLLPTMVAVLFFVGGVFAGINIGKLYGPDAGASEKLVFETKQFIDDLGQEPIESLIINLYPENDDTK